MFDNNMKKHNEVSDNVVSFIETIKSEVADKEKWGDVFAHVFANTLETTIRYHDDGKTYIRTGDIPAMWLRDSTAQVRPYLILAQNDPELALTLKGLITRQMEYIVHDPYANAFNETGNGQGYQSDLTEMSDLVWERKYEIDSLAYPLQLAYLYYKNTNDDSVFDKKFVAAAKAAIHVWKTEQNHETSDYTFERDTWRLEDTLINDGKGSKVGYTGMTWSGFRPSDDACCYHYLVPSNMFAVVVLGYIEDVARDILSDQSLENEARILKEEIQKGIETYAIVEHKGKRVYAYEVDGLGNYTLMDDPNVPSLLSAPYLGYCDFDDEVYQNTRALILSTDNPYYYSGSLAKGCGSSHTPENMIWPIALTIEGLTHPETLVKESLLDVLVNTDAGTLMMHESFDVNNPQKYTREWFSWANMMFCELLLDYLGYQVKR